MWNLLLADIIKLNIHVHMYISNNFIRTTQQFEVEKILILAYFVIHHINYIFDGYRVHMAGIFHTFVML